MGKKATLLLNSIEARRLALSAGAAFGRPRDHGPAAVAEVVDRIGFVQIDTISVVVRAHHHIIGSRIPSYRQDWLEGAPVFEYWAHAAAYLPWRDFRHTLPRKARIAANGHDWFRINRDEARRVRDRISAEGPLMARDFQGEHKSEGWWDWKPAKRALEYLFQAGELMVLPRRGFQKVFDLAERVIPAGVDTRAPTPREQAAWYVDRALDAWGLVARDEIAYQRREHLDPIDGVLGEQEESGSLIPALVEGIPRTRYWVRPKDLEGIDRLPVLERKLRILSPFDPLIIHRRRAKRLFGLDYSLECYLPAEKRTFAHFALPLLRGDRFVGLLDAKADRAAGVLRVRGVRYNGSERGRASFDAALTRALEDFAALNGLGAWTGEL